MCFTWGKEMPITVEKAVRFFPGKIKLLRKPEKARCSQWIGSLSVVAFGSVVVQSTIAPGQFRWFFCPPFARYKRSPLNVWSNIPYKATIRYFLSGDINVFFQHNVINIQLEYQSQGAFLVFLLIVQLKGNKTRERAAFQLQSLVEQLTDEKPSAAHRLRMAHSCPLKS